jgi:hypothetical protein
MIQAELISIGAVHLVHRVQALSDDCRQSASVL